jgi:hypothetical protein
MPNRQRSKGDRIEREIVQRHVALGVKAARVPLSGATGYQGNGADIDLYPFGPDAAPFVAEVKARGNEQGRGFKTIETWLADYDVLFLRRDQKEPLVVLPWASWARLLKGGPPVAPVGPPLGPVGAVSLLAESK